MPKHPLIKSSTAHKTKSCLWWHQNFKVQLLLDFNLVQCPDLGEGRGEMGGLSELKLSVTSYGG